ncbi:MAG TPA: hypothetical protein VIV15_17410 [Anaerolineales bacterium]
MLDLSDKLDLRWLAWVVADLRKAAPDTDLLLVGAVARDILLSHAHGITLARVTSDADVAFAAPSWEAFEAIRHHLLESGLFEKPMGARHKLQHRSGVMIDLIPFGGIERPNGSIAWPPEHDEVVGVLGFSEAQASAMKVLLPEEQVTDVVALPMLAVLKVFAWSERHLRAPRKDAADLHAILSYYLDTGQDDRIFNEAAHLLEAPDFDYRLAAAWLVGYDARAIVNRHSNRSERITEKLIHVLHEESDVDGPLNLAGEMSLFDPEFARRLLAAFLAGFQGK